MDTIDNRKNLPTSEESIDFAQLAIACLAGLSLAVTAIFLCAVPFAGNMAGSRDFVSYWATGYQLVHHADPYDREAMMRIEHIAGLKDNAVLLMRNPPWALPLAYPLGLMGLRTAAIIWSLVALGCLFTSVHLIRIINGRPKNRLHWLGLSFPPALICLIMGQTSLFALLGLVLFLYLHRARPFAAGISLWLCALKPQLFLPFAVTLAFWILVQRNYRLLAGSVSAMAASCAAAYYLDRAAWPRYLQMMHAPEINREFIPCLSDALRLWLSPSAVWLQYLPATICCIWALCYFWPRRDGWDWNRESSTLMLVSLLAAPYCWLYDQGLAIPALIQGAYRTRSRSLLTLLALICILIDIELFNLKITSALFLWTAPAWLAWYLFASRQSI